MKSSIKISNKVTYKIFKFTLKLQQYLEYIGTIHKYPKQNKVIYSIDSNKDLQKLLLLINIH